MNMQFTINTSLIQWNTISLLHYASTISIINITTDDYYCYYHYIFYETFFLNL